VLYFVACAAGITFLGSVLTELDVRFNLTPSIPVGIYRLTPALPTSRLSSGMLVAVCAPLKAAELGRRRGYLEKGACPADAEPLLKMVAGVADDRVAISTDGVAVNGHLLPHSRPLRSDTAGRQLWPWPERRNKLRNGQVWLYAYNDRSWDSRYWGPAPAGNVLAHLVPLLTLPSVPWEARLPAVRLSPNMR
jgi:conjugative transfer signal peptidase TraF